MIKNTLKISQIFLIALLLVACNGSATNVDRSYNDAKSNDSKSVTSSQNLVANQAEFKEAVKKAKAGDTIVLKNGVWNDFEMVFDAEGTEDKPITLTVEEKGKVVISGKSNLRIAGEHLVVSGLVFKNGYTPTKEVISFRTSNDRLANHTRVTEVVIDHFNNPERHERDFWVMMYGKHNRFDHNHLEGKNNAGVTMAVRLNSKASQENYHRIDHNYFGPRQVLGSNGGETLRIGTSHFSLTDSHTLVENNYFDRCNGEVEIVSGKSGRNTFRGNVFFESQGTLTLRHGNDNLIENNVFLGNGVPHTGGFRVINKRQTVRNNYMYGLKGYRFGGALVVMNGVPNSPINRYHQVEDSVIENNSIIDSDHIEFAAGADEERSAPPITTSFSNNLVVNREAKDSIGVHDDISGITFNNNVASGVNKLPSDQGFTEQTISLVKAENGLLYPSDTALKRAGVSSSLSVLDKNLTGASWYPKPDASNRFAGGKEHQIKPGQDTLTEAVAKANAGDVIVLAAGDYQVTKIIVLDKPITVKGSGQVKPNIKYERTTLFELVDGGSVKMDNLSINGEDSPDTYGNSVVRTTRYSMLTNYEVHAENLDVKNLNVNHSFHFLKVAGHTFADNVVIKNSAFEKVSGHVVALEREIDDLGIYNAEYLTIENSSFKDIGGTIANVYRCCTDESTFGPHVSISGNQLDNVGKNKKRNKTKASVYLVGAQVVTIANNQLNNSAPVKITETVGDPITRLSDNQYNKTDKAIIADYVY